MLVKTDAKFSEKYHKALKELRKIIPHLKPDQTIYQELTFLKAQNKTLIERDKERRDLIISLQRKVNRLPQRYKEQIITLFVAEKIYTTEDQNIFI
jgi:RNase adaptor protein for sRNA GlmZ degradation